MNKALRYISIFILLSIHTLKIGAQDPVIFNIGCVEDLQGTSHCIDITVENFENIESYQFALIFDPNVVMVTSIITTNSCLSAAGLDESDFFLGTERLGHIRTLWDPSDGIPKDCPDGSNLFTVCFDLVGEPGECSPITIGSLGSFDFVVDFPGPGEANTIINTCDNCVTTNTLTIVSGYCETSPNGGDNGVLTFYPVGGNAPYNFTVTRNATLIGTGSLNERQEWKGTMLPQGTYVITITDDSGTSTTKNVNITQNFPLEFIMSGTDPTCFYRENGTAEITTPTGGQAPYSFQWSNNIFNQTMIEDLPSGQFFVSVTDAFGCEVVDSITLSVDTVKANVTILDPFYCKGGMARVLLEGTGGNISSGNNYDFRINGFRIPNSTTFLLNANLKVTGNEFYVVDSGSPRCTSEVVTFDIPIANEMDISFEYLEDANCMGDLGRVRVRASILGETNFLFFLQELPSGTNVFGGVNGSDIYFNDDVLPGNYRINVESTTRGCKDTVEFTINEPPPPIQLDTNIISPSCSGDDGRIEVVVSGGTAPFTFSWAGLATTDSIIENTNGGDFKVVVTDAQGCSDSLQFSLAMGGSLTAEANVLRAITCNGANDGELIVNVSPPGSYTYEWINDQNQVIGTTQTIDNVAPGTYIVNVISPDCTAKDTVTIFNPPGMEFDSIVITRPECFGFNGRLGVIVSGGFMPYSYVWRIAGTTTVVGAQSVLTNIKAGTYEIQVTDQAGCSIITEVVLADPPIIDVDITNIIGVTCSGESSGQATATASGGSQGATSFTYFWSNGEITQSAVALPAGQVWVIASDTKCSSDTIFLNIPDAIPLDATADVEPVSCSELCDGVATLVPSGGTGAGYMVDWPSINQSGLTISNLCPGPYDYIISDSDGCEFTGLINITRPDTLTLEIDSSLTRRVSCRTGTGQIAVLADGGNGGYQYSWTNDVGTTSLIEGLTPGMYMVTVTDSKGCTAVTNYELNGIAPVRAVIPTPDEPNCFGELTCVTVTSASGGVGGPYSFQLNSGPRFPLDTCISVFAGSVRVNVFDEAGCSLDTTIFIDQPDEISVDIGDDIEVVLGKESQEIQADITNTLPIDSISWSLIDSFECVNDEPCKEIVVKAVNNQTVTVYIQDINGCSATDELFISVSDVREVYFPNIFSPDGNTLNDYFIPAVGPGVEIINTLQIFDRFGNRLYVQDNFLPNATLTDGWDGKLNGNELNPGVYVYYAQVTFIDGRVLYYSGDVTLVR